MLTAALRMSRSGAGSSITNRIKSITQHMLSTTTQQPTPSEPPVLFESKSAVRAYILNRPLKLNALDEPMLNLLRGKIEEWSKSDLCGAIIGQGNGRAFCAGGDVASVVQNAADESTRAKAIDFFKREFEMDYILATLRKPYVAILDGHTMGGGVGLAAHAPFRIATENTVFAMPETKIGYFPDVGASYFMSRLDGELGTYLALTSDTLKGRAVFELGFATHYIPSRRIPMLIEQLSALEEPKKNDIDRTIEEYSSEREAHEPLPPLTGDVRVALDLAFRHDRVEAIVEELQSISKYHEDLRISEWAQKTLDTLKLRSPTSLKVALRAIRKGREMTLLEALNMELKIATAFCNGASPDFAVGVKAVIVDKIRDTPKWSPASISEVSDATIHKNFFSADSRYLSSAPTLTVSSDLLPPAKPMQFALPTEREIAAVVRGESSASRSGSTGITLEELVFKITEARGGKIGVMEKVVEVATRQCDIVDNKDGNFVWLQWKPRK